MRLSLCLIGCAGLAAAGATNSAGGGDGRIARARYAMGTLLEIETLAPDADSAEAGVTAAFHAVEEVERRLSNWREDSELSVANRSAALRPAPLSGATYRSLFRALSFARETGGTFDPTVGGASIGWENARLDPDARTLFFTRPGGAVDSGGFGKGEGLDHALAALARHGVTAARLNFGGQISLTGTATRAARRRGLCEVAVGEPREGSSRELGRFSPGDASISTSSQAERPGHIRDPRTGGAALFRGSVTVVADTGFAADALSTALFVLGPEEGLDFADRRGIAALYVVPRGQEWQLVPSVRFPQITRVEEVR
ncbi:MAG: FAD:protein FMN transferase [Acidobacteriota bacterium]